VVLSGLDVRQRTCMESMRLWMMVEFDFSNDAFGALCGVWC